MPGLDDIIHATSQENVPDEEIKASIIIHILKNGKVKLSFPEDIMSLEDCGKIMYTATTVVLENIKGKKAIKPADPNIVEKLKK